MLAYLASGWFTPEQKKSMDGIRNILLEEGFAVFAPFYDGVVLKGSDPPELRRKVFELDIGTIDKCNLVVVAIEGFEPGTIFEFGYACRAGVPIIAYSDYPGRRLNVMLEQAAIAFANGPEELRSKLRNYARTVGES